MKLIQTITLCSLLGSSLLSSESIIDTVGLNIGVANTPYSQTNTNGSITLGNNPDETFTSYEIYTQLKPFTKECKENNIKPTISYTYSLNSELKHQYILAGFNQYFKNSYLGIVVGYGELKYKYNPINNSKSNDYTATAPIIGLQTGYDHPLTKKLSLGVNLKALRHNYNTDLNPNDQASSKINHNHTLIASFAIGWRF